MTKTPKVVALVPSRSGSKRITDKNINRLNGHPLIAYTVCAALQSGIFESVIVSTDSERYAEISSKYGAEIPFLRPREFAGSLSPDIEWVRYTLERLRASGREYDCFSILRPTSPFRQPETIQRAWDLFLSGQAADSLRAVEKCKQHPGKMWIIHGNRMHPLLPFTNDNNPWHSCQYQSLPEIYAQNASLEIARTRVVFESGTIAGNNVMPFITNEYEGFDINTMEDWLMAEHIVNNKLAKLPVVKENP